MATAKQRYAKLSAKRQPYLDRARNCAAVTIPSLFPPEGSAGHSYRNPNQSFASTCVNTLAAKMLVGLFPPNVPFFKQTMSKRAQEELTQSNKRLLKEILRVLGQTENEAQSEAESLGWRTTLEPCLANNIVGGNYLLHMQDEGTLRGFSLEQYVTRRAHSGTLLELVVHEKVDIEELPEATREAVVEVIEKDKAKQLDGEDPEPLDLYTHIRLVRGRYEVRQEVEGVVVEGSEGTHPKDRLPWIASRWKSRPGEHYGRSMVEDYFGDLDAHDVVSKAIREATAIGARTVFLRRPGGATRAGDIAKAENGDVIDGRPEDVGVLKVEKQVDLAVAERFLDRLEQRLSRSFLMHSSARRDAERVTLGELRFMINELNEALGGVYAVLAQEVQRPLAILHLGRMTRANLLPALPREATRLSIVTGLEALSREQDLMNLHQGLKYVADIYGPEVLAQVTHPDNVIQRIFTALRIDPDGAIKSEEEIMAEQQQQQMAALVQQLGPDAMKMLQQQQQQQGNPGNGQTA